MDHTTSNKSFNKINARYIISHDLLQEICDSNRTTYRVEDDFEYFEFFSKELILMFSTTPDDYFGKLVQRRKDDLAREEESIDRLHKYIVLPLFIEQKESYISDYQYDYEYLSTIDDTLLFAFIRSIGPAKAIDLIGKTPDRYSELFSKMEEMYYTWLHAYINGLSFLVNQNKTSMISSLLSGEDLKEVFFSGMKVLRDYMICKKDDTIEAIHQDMTNALLLLNKLSDISQYLLDSNIIRSDTYDWFVDYKTHFADQFEYRLQMIGSQRSGAERHKKILI